jgi:hypothetical protein
MSPTRKTRPNPRPPKPAPAFTVAMPIESLAQLSESLPRLVQQLVESGRLKRRDPEPARTG